MDIVTNKGINGSHRKHFVEPFVFAGQILGMKLLLQLSECNLAGRRRTRSKRIAKKPKQTTNKQTK
jgi:hypothetical protein